MTNPKDLFYNNVIIMNNPQDFHILFYNNV